MKVGDTITLHAIVTGLGGIEGAGEPQFVQLDLGGKIINDVPAGFCQLVNPVKEVPFAEIPAEPVKSKEPVPTGAGTPEESIPVAPLQPETKGSEDSVGEKFSDAPTAPEEKPQSSQPEQN